MAVDLGLEAQSQSAGGRDKSVAEPAPLDGSVPLRVQVEFRDAQELLVLAVEHFKQKPTNGIWEHIKDKVPILTAVAAAIISCATLYYGYQFNARDAALKQTQQRFEKDRARQSEVTDYLSKDRDTLNQTVAADFLIHQWGADLMPDMRVVLALPNSTIRRRAVLVVQELYQQLYHDQAEAHNLPDSGGVTTSVLLKQLADYYKDKSLRTGVLEIFAGLVNLSEVEQKQAVDLVKSEFNNDRTKCVTDDDQQLFRAALQLLQAMNFGTMKDSALERIKLTIQMFGQCENGPLRDEAINTEELLVQISIVSKLDCQDTVATLRKLLRSREENDLIENVSHRCNSK